MPIMKTYFGIFFLYILLYSNSGFGQEKVVMLTGKVQSFNNDVSNILVVNLNSKKSTITNTLGLFTLEVKLRDSVRFSAVQYISKEITITKTILNQNILIIDLKEIVINLDEVMVMPYNLTGEIDFDIKRLGIKSVVTSSSLGLPNADIEVMTQSERLLLEADRGKFVKLATIEDKGKLAQIAGYLTLSVLINTHKIMNRLNGRTKSFKNMVARDENIILENKIVDLFSKRALSEGFGIPENNIDAFLTFCLYQTDFSQLSEGNNTIEIWEYLKAKSCEYKETNYLKE